MKNVDLSVLFQAVCEVESRYDPSAVGDGGASVGIAQIHERGALADMKRISGTDYTPNARYSIVKSWEIFCHYLLHYGEAYRRKEGKEPTYQVLARIWNGGPNGWRMEATVSYWRKVSKALEKWKKQFTTTAPKSEEKSISGDAKIEAASRDELTMSVERQMASARRLLADIYLMRMTKDDERRPWLLRSIQALDVAGADSGAYPPQQER